MLGKQRVTVEGKGAKWNIALRTHVISKSMRCGLRFAICEQRQQVLTLNDLLRLRGIQPLHAEQQTFKQWESRTIYVEIVTDKKRRLKTAK